MVVYELPVEFHSPYTLDECANRLKMLIGQEFLHAQVEGQVVKVDEKRFDFRLHAYNYRFLKGAPNRYSDDVTDADIGGFLNANEDRTTYFLAESALTSDKYRQYLAAVVIVTFAVGTIAFSAIGHSLGLGLILGLIAAFFVALLTWYQRSYDADKLLDLLRSTLEAEPIQTDE